jgi:hypothetical protein
MWRKSTLSMRTASGYRRTVSNALSTKSKAPKASTVLPLFPGLPQTVSLKNLPKPEMKRSTLRANGLRVSSQETYGQLCNFGVSSSFFALL